jgi:hypothetical protein
MLKEKAKRKSVPRSQYFRRGAVHDRKIKKNYIEKNCMMCYRPFMSEGNHNRICCGCKQTDDWQYGNDYKVMK